MNYINITFTGFHNKRDKGVPQVDSVIVDTILLKLCHKKRKDVTSPVMQMSVGQSRVAYNPDCGKSNGANGTASAISVPSSSLNFNNGHLVKSFVLLFRVSCADPMPQNGLCNRNSNDMEEPLSKRRKNGRNFNEEEEKVYGAEMVLFDKHRRCFLTNGDYELLLQEVELSKSLPRKNSSWETIDDVDNTLGQFVVFNWGPTLRFSIRWNNESVSGSVPMPPALVPRSPSAVNNNHLNVTNNHCTNGRSNAIAKESSRMSATSAERLTKKKPRIFYQFLYNNNTRQQTEAREDLHCPWCSLSCAKLYSLLKHLKLCHSRFLFTYVPHPKGARIDVSINDSYDGSFSGNPHDLHSFPPGFAFSRNGPVRRTPVTAVTLCRPKRTPQSMSEFMETDDSEYDVVRPYINGHNRLYHHTGTCLPIRPLEIDIDSEGENDPEWLRIKTNHMIDEFTDVNEGEKELMKMWNLHVMKFGFVGDCQIPLACRIFASLHGRQIIRKKLYRNFVLHLSNLLDFGLIGAAALYNTLRQLHAIEDELGSSNGGQPDDPMPSNPATPESRSDNYGPSVVSARKKCSEVPRFEFSKPS